MKVLIISSLILSIGMALYFYLNGGAQLMPTQTPVAAQVENKIKVTVSQDFKFSSQELEQIQPAE